MTIPGVVFLITVPTESYENVLKLALNDAEKENKILKSRSQDELRQNQQCLHDGKEKILSKSEAHIYDNFVTIEEDILDANNSIEYSQSMEKILRVILEKFKIVSYTLTTDENKHFLHAMFSLKTGEVCEVLLEQLQINNIGSTYQSSVSVTPCSLYYYQTAGEKETSENSDEEKQNLKTNNYSRKCENLGPWGKFVQSVRARLTIGQVVESVKADALLTFDFVFLVIMSTLMCAIGLVENSNIILLSSMLISPMMGPVMAVTFGTVLRDYELRKTGVISEIVGLGIATIVGFLYGCIISLCYDKYGDSDWPTAEMISRGELGTLGVGSLIALLSGATIAVGVLSHNVASLVGVAISTSLMPPAVNAGLLWAMTCVYYVKSPANARYASLSFTDYYSDDRATELTCLGAVSMCLTFANIICIYASSILVFKIKEVAPVASKDLTRRQFWQQVKITRNYNRLQNSSSTKLSSNIPDDHLSETQKLRFADLLHHSTDLARDPVKINIGKTQYTWSPCSFNECRPSIQQINDVYQEFVKQKRHLEPTSIQETVEDKEEIARKNSIRKKFTVTLCPNDPLIKL